MSKVIAASAMALGGGGVAVTGAYAMGWFGDSEPEVHLTLNKLGTDEASGYANKVGKQYEYFLVAPDKEENKKWWEWSYRRWQKESSDESALSDEFKKAKLKDAFSTSNSSTDSKPLNKVCDDVYKKGTTDVGIDQTEDKKKKLTRDLFRYCSVLGDLPSTVKDKSQVSGDTKIGKKEEQKLISTAEGENEKFWNIKSEWFKALNVTDQNEYFGKNVGTGASKKSLRAVCSDAYNSDDPANATDGQPKKDNVIKYCSLDTSGVTGST